MSIIKQYKEDPKTLIAHVWYLTLVFIVISAIVAIAVAAENSNTGDGSAGFAAIWTCLLCIAIGFGGTMVMRKFTSSLMVGFLLGVCSTMAQLQFLIFVVFLYYSDEAGSDSKSADQAASAFAFFLFIIFSLFSVVLFFYRNAIMINTSLAGQDSTATGSAAASPASTPTQAQSLAA